MTESNIQMIDGAHVWRGADLAVTEDWIMSVPDAALGDLDAIVAEARNSGAGPADFQNMEPEIRSLRELSASLRHELGDGYGFAVLRGIDVDRYSADELKIMLLVLGHHVGPLNPQVGHDIPIGEVTNTDTDGPKNFYYHLGGPLPAHMDPVDVVALLCVRAAKRGGDSGIVSSMAVHNEILGTRPDLLEILYRGYPNLDRHKLDAEGKRMLNGDYCPVFADIGSETVCSYLPSSIYMTEEFGLVEFSEAEREALDFLDATAARPDLVLKMSMEPGDIQLLNNRRILHTRDDYEDYPEPERRRLLLRVWMTIDGWGKYPANIPHSDAENPTKPS
ncbi:MAG: TauD/TfdA family dioxygenase [Rhodospirillales bacterium]|nr:TauD/TfdA family dioxygenase [Rhodospirillales bacterium]